MHLSRQVQTAEERVKATAHNPIKKTHISTWLPLHESFRQLHSDTGFMHHLQSISLETKRVMEHGDLEGESRRKGDGREEALSSGALALVLSCSETWPLI